MIKMTIATDSKGAVIGAIQEDSRKPARGEPRATPTFAGGHKLHRVDVAPELDMAKAKDATVFHEGLKRYVPKSG